MVEIFGQLVEAEILRDARHAPGLGDRLEGADQQLAGILLEIGLLVRHPQGRQVAGQARNALGQDVEMLAGMQRHIHPGHAADRMPPHAGAVDHVVGDDIALRRGHSGDPTLHLMDRGDGDVLEDPGAVLAGTLGQSQGDIARVALPVLRQVYAAQHALAVQQRIVLQAFGGGDILGLDAEHPSHGGAAPQLLHALAVEGDDDRSVALEPGGRAGLGLQPAIELLGVFGQPGQIAAGAKLGDQPGRVPGGAAGQLLALQ